MAVRETGGVRRPRTIVAGLVAIAAVATACSWRGADVAEGAEQSGGAEQVAVAERGEGPRAAAREELAVGWFREGLVDESRPTPPNGEFAGAPERAIEVLLFYPAEGDVGGGAVEGAEPALDEGPFPLLVFSHGYTGSAESYRALLAKLAGHGYVVAASDHPLSNGRAPGGPTVLDTHHQPGDVSFVVDELLVLAGDPAPDAPAAGDSAHPLAGLVDAERLAVGGHSLGGVTTLMSVFHTCCLDERFDGAVVLAGLRALAPSEGRWFPPGVGTPVLFVHGDQDATVPHAGGRYAFEEAPPPKYLVTLLGAGHTTPFRGGENTRASLTVDAMLAFLDAHVAERPGALERLTAVAQVEGVATLEVGQPPRS